MDAELDRLKAERATADREYNEALTRLDRAIQQLPPVIPDPPPLPDEHQIAPLNALWKIDAAPPGSGVGGHILALLRRAFRPFYAQQQAFNAALVDHLNRNVPVGRDTRASIVKTQILLRDQLDELLRFQSLLVRFLQQITPYVDTRDRDVAGLLRGLSGAINAVADEVLKRSEATLARDRRHELRVTDVEAKLADLAARLNELQRALGSGAVKQA